MCTYIRELNKDRDESPGCAQEEGGRRLAQLQKRNSTIELEPLSPRTPRNSCVGEGFASFNGHNAFRAYIHTYIYMLCNIEQKRLKAPRQAALPGRLPSGRNGAACCFG